jgi:hypothetical protein
LHTARSFKKQNGALILFTADTRRGHTPNDYFVQVPSTHLSLASQNTDSIAPQRSPSASCKMHAFSSATSLLSSVRKHSRPGSHWSGSRSGPSMVNRTPVQRAPRGRRFHAQRELTVLLMPALRFSHVRYGLQSPSAAQASSKPFPGVFAGLARSGVKHLPSAPHTSFCVLGQRVLGVVHVAGTPPAFPQRPNTQMGFAGAHSVNSLPGEARPVKLDEPEKEPSGAVAGPVHVKS